MSESTGLGDRTGVFPQLHSGFERRCYTTQHAPGLRNYKLLQDFWRDGTLIRVSLGGTGTAFCSHRSFQRLWGFLTIGNAVCPTRGSYRERELKA